MDHHLLLLEVEHLDAGLDHSATVLVGRVLEHVATNVFEDNVKIFFSNTGHKLNFLNHVIAEAVEDYLFKPDARILENRIKERVLLSPASIGVDEPLLDESAAPLVFATRQLESGGDLKAALWIHYGLMNQFERANFLLRGLRDGRSEGHSVLIQLGWLPLRKVLLVMLVRNSVLGSLLLIIILWIEWLLVNRLFLIDLCPDSCEQVVALQINILERFQVTSYHLLYVINFSRVHTRADVAGRILFTHLVNRFGFLNLRDRV